MSMLTLNQFLDREVRLYGMDPKLSSVLLSIADACKIISHKVRAGALAGVLGMAGTENVQGEDQKKLDIISNDIFVNALFASGEVCGLVSEEIPEVISVPEEFPIGPYLVAFDPLDGSSNIDINVSIGSIFAINAAVRPKREAVEADFLMPGNQLKAGGYCMYGPQTQLVISVGRGVMMFTLDPNTGTFMLVQEGITVSPQAKEFAINCSNMRHWEAPVKRYIDELLAGKTGVRGKDFNMRWIAAMVTEVHRILQRGGVFMYPRDNRDPKKAGKLRLLYEAIPMSFLIENAGGRATNGHQRILDIVPEAMHQRVAVFLGAQEEVDLVTCYHQEH